MFMRARNYLPWIAAGSVIGLIVDSYNRTTVYGREADYGVYAGFPVVEISDPDRYTAAYSFAGAMAGSFVAYLLEKVTNPPRSQSKETKSEGDHRFFARKEERVPSQDDSLQASNSKLKKTN